MADIRQFSLEIDNFVAGVPQKMSKLLRRTAFSIMRDLVMGSPVDTGRFRASWFIGIGRPDRRVMPPRAQIGRQRTSNAALNSFIRLGNSSGAESLDRLSVLSPQTVTGHQPIIISNNLPYGPALADGHSGQAPRGWIDAAVSKADREIKAMRDL